MSKMKTAEQLAQLLKNQQIDTSSINDNDLEKFISENEPLINGIHPQVQKQYITTIRRCINN